MFKSKHYVDSVSLVPQSSMHIIYSINIPTGIFLLEISIAGSDSPGGTDEGGS